MALRIPISVPHDDEANSHATPVAIPTDLGSGRHERNLSQADTSPASISKRSAQMAIPQQSLLHKFYCAAKHGNVSAVRCLLQEGANVDWCLLGQWRAVDLAAVGGHLQLLQALQQAGASIEHCHNSPFYLACARNDLEIVRFLLQAGANPIDTARDTGRTALHWAAAMQDGVDGHGNTAPCALLQLLLALLPPESSTISCPAGTPLHVALRLKRYGNAAGLLQAFPQHALVSGNGVCTLDVALKCRDPRALALVSHAPLPMGGAAALTELPKLQHAARGTAASAVQWMLLCCVLRRCGQLCSSANVRLLRAALAGKAARMDAIVAQGAEPAMLQTPGIMAILMRAEAQPSQAPDGFSVASWLQDRGLQGMQVPVSPVWHELDETEVDSDSS